MIFKDPSIKKIFLSVASFSSAYIFGPIFVLGTIGYIIDKKFNSGPKFLLISIGISFVISNILLFKKRESLSRKFKNKIDKIVSS